MAESVICGVARTPFGRFGGKLKSLSLPDLGAIAVRGALERAGVPGERIEELVLGVNLPGSDRSVARQVSLTAGLPETLDSFTVDRACCSSLVALSLASRSVRGGDAYFVLAGGVENLSRVPYFVEDMRWGHRLGDIQLKDQLVLACPYTSNTRAVQADWEGANHDITREDADAWALRSHRRAAEAQDKGLFAEEIVAVPDERGGILLDVDESIRPDTTLEALASLRTVYDTERVTAGNAPGLNTGAAAIVLGSEPVARELEVPILGRVLASARASGHPDALARMPAVAAEKVLKRAGVALSDIDVIEVNEAFAVVPLVTTLRLADGDDSLVAGLRERTNINGGSIALGHPTGASGARLVMTALFELRRRGGGLALITICGGIGEAEAMVISVTPDDLDGEHGA